MLNDERIGRRPPIIGTGADVAAGLERLAALTYDTSQSADDLIVAVLTLLAESLEVGATFLARTDETTLRIERAHDRAAMGLADGMAIPLCDTYCTALLASERRSLVVEDARSDPHFAALATTHDLGIGAYSGVALYHGDGRLYGTLCTLHPHPRAMSSGEPMLLALAGRIIMQSIDAAAEVAALRESQLLLQSEYLLLHDVAATADSLRAAYDAVACGVVVQDSGGSIIYANSAAEAVLGLSLAQMQGVTSLDPRWQALHEDGSEYVGENHPAAIALRTREPQHNVTMGVRVPGGGYRWLRVDAVPILGDDGAAVQMIASFIDITERKRAQEEAQRERDFNSAVVDTAASLIMVLDRQGRVVRFNTTAQRVTGYTAAEARGAAFWDLFVVSEDVMAIVDGDCVAIARFPARFACYWAPPEGTWRLIEWSTTLLDGDDREPAFVVAIGVDVTDRKQAIADLRASEERLALQYAVTAALARSATLETAIPALLETICAHLQWDVGLLWRPDTDENALRCAEIWQRAGRDMAAFVDDSRASAFARGVGLPGRVWQQEAPAWIVDIVVDHNYLRSDSAATTGLHGAVCFPVVVGGVIYGAMEFCSRNIEPPNSDVEQTLASLGVQIGQFIERRRAEEALRASEERFRSLIEKAPVGAFITDEHGIFETVNDAFSSMMGYGPEEMIGHHMSMVVPQRLRRERAEIYASRIAAQVETQSEFDVISKEGDTLVILATSMPIAGSDGRSRRATFAIDITARKRAEQHLATLAHHDALTGLPNRRLFHNQLTQALSHANRYGRLVALLFLDLDGFKAVNDTRGHDMGDLLLKAVAQRLTRCIRETDMAARLAGDEFTVILPDVGSGDNASAVARKIISDIGKSFALEGRSATVGVSIGIGLYPFDGHDADSLLKSADTAMYRAKRAGKNTYRLFSAMSDDEEMVGSKE